MRKRKRMRMSNKEKEKKKEKEPKIGWTIVIAACRMCATPGIKSAIWKGGRRGKKEMRNEKWGIINNKIINVNKRIPLQPP